MMLDIYRSASISSYADHEAKSRQKHTRLLLSLQALINIAQKLEQLHANGWVHRDVKPGNILWVPREHSWTLMDFGSAARTGMPDLD